MASEAQGIATPLRRNTLANIAGRAGSALLWLMVTPFVLHRLGPERFGVWSLFFAFASYLVALDLGLGSTMVRFIAAARVTGGRVAVVTTLRRGLALALALGVLWGAAAFALRPWIVDLFHMRETVSEEALIALSVFAASVAPLFLTQVLLSCLQGFERLDLSNLCFLLGISIQVVLLVVGLAQGGGLVAAAWAGLAGTTATAMAASWAMWRLTRKLDATRPGMAPSWPELARFAVALQLISVLVVLQLQTGKVVLGILGDLRMVTDFELAFRVASAAAGIPVLILGAAIPAVSRAWTTSGLSAVADLYQRTSRWLYAAGALVLGALWVLAYDLCRLWLGPDHQAVGGLLRLWIAAFAVNILWGPGTATARGMGHPWMEVGALGASFLVQLALAWLWIPAFGTVGAVCALLVSFAVGMVFFLSIFHARTSMPFLPWLSRALLPRLAAAIVAAGAATWLLGLITSGRAGLASPGLERGALGALLYFSLLLLLLLPAGDVRGLARLARNPWGALPGAPRPGDRA